MPHDVPRDRHFLPGNRRAGGTLGRPRAGQRAPSGRMSWEAGLPQSGDSGDSGAVARSFLHRLDPHGTTHTAVGPALATKYCVIRASHLAWNGRFIVRQPFGGEVVKRTCSAGHSPTEGGVPRLPTREATVGCAPAPTPSRTKTETKENWDNCWGSLVTQGQVSGDCEADFKARGLGLPGLHEEGQAGRLRWVWVPAACGTTLGRPCRSLGCFGSGATSCQLLTRRDKRTGGTGLGQD